MRFLLHGCVRLFPRPFRLAFGADVADQAMQDCRRARARSRLAGAWALVASATNILRAAMAERIRPVWPPPAARPSKGTRLMTLLDQWRLDVTYAVRTLRRSPGFTAITVLTLALAIGVTAGIFSVVNTVLIRPLPYGNADRLVYIGSTAPGSDFPPEFGVSVEFYLHYRDRARSLESLSTFTGFTSTLRVNERVERVVMSGATYTLFDTLGAAPMLGALPNAETADQSAVISYRMWQDWLGGRDNVIGESYFMGGGNRTIAGVMGPDFRFPVEGTMLWLTGDIREEGLTIGRFGTRLVGRMAPGVTIDEASQELTALSKELPGRFGGSANYARFIEQYRAVVRPLADQLLGTASRPLWILLAAAGVVLLIACANVANLFLVRAEGRQREMAVRRAIGAHRGQLLRVQMAEVLLIALAAGAAAVAFTSLTLPAFLGAAPAGIPRLADAGLDGATLAFTAVLAIAAGLLCGLLPAFRAARPSMRRLQDGSRGSTRGRTWTRNLLVAGQTALALVLLIGSGLLMRSYAKLSAVNPGYDTRDVFTFQIAPQQPSLTDGPSYARFIMEFSDRLRALPGVQSVGVIENVPLDEGTSSGRFNTDDNAGEQGPLINQTFAGADYFETMGIPVLAGRAFTREDAVSSLGHAIVSRSAARMLWPDADPVGRRLQRAGLTTWETVVGVVEDVIQSDFRQAGDPLIYFPLQGQLPTQWALSSPAYVVKTPRADTIAPDVLRIVREMAPEAPMYRAYTMAGLVERNLINLSFTMLTLGLVSSLALILGAVGLYGVLSYVVTERTREIGVRMALGAQVGAVRRMVVAQGARVIGAGIVAGLSVALVTTRFLGTLLFGVEALDPATFAGTAAAMVLVGLVASYVPARRASNVDPIESLRGD